MPLTDAAQATWSAVDALFEQLLIGEDEALARVTHNNLQHNLPPIAVSAAQGKLLHLLARLGGARHILEIGTLGGYSTIWMARALAHGNATYDGLITTLEINPQYAAIATENFKAAGVASLIDLHRGPAIETLPILHRTMTRPYDMVFIDADKPSNAAYLSWALKMSRPGTLIIVDNVVRDGAILDPDPDDKSRGALDALKLLGSLPSISSTALQMVGTKGYDGFALGIVNSV